MRIVERGWCGVVAGWWRGELDKSLYTMVDKLKKSNRESRMDHRLSDTTISITDPDYAGLPLALPFSEHLRAISFDVDAGQDR